MSPLSKLVSVGDNRIHLEEVDSTNTYAHLLLSKSKPVAGTAITTSFQTNGRGQIGRYWYSSSGKNVLCSIILYPTTIAAADQFWLSIAVSCAMRSVISSYISHEPISIKWPNDIYVGRKKIGGLLIQNSLKGNKISNTIVGMGININEPVFPKELPNPTSLLLLSHEAIDLDEFYKSLFLAVAKYYQKLIFNQNDALRSEYLEHLYKINEEAKYELPDGKIITGKIKNITEQGKLIVEVDGEVLSFAFREISLAHQS